MLNRPARRRLKSAEAGHLETFGKQVGQTIASRGLSFSGTHGDRRHKPIVCPTSVLTTDQNVQTRDTGLTACATSLQALPSGWWYTHVLIIRVQKVGGE